MNVEISPCLESRLHQTFAGVVQNIYFACLCFCMSEQLILRDQDIGHAIIILSFSVDVDAQIQHGGAVASTVTPQRGGPGFDSAWGLSVWGLQLCLHGFCPITPASSDSPRTCMLG